MTGGTININQRASVVTGYPIELGAAGNESRTP